MNSPNFDANGDLQKQPTQCTKKHYTQREGHLIALQGILIPEPVLRIDGEWVYFLECPNPDYCYWLGGINTPSRMLGLIRHVGGKTWCTRRTVVSLIALLDPSHVDTNFGAST